MPIIAFGLRRFKPRKSFAPLHCPYCGAAASLVRRVPHPELGPSAALHTFDCTDCGPWSEIALKTAHGCAAARDGARTQLTAG
jgi:hypothetical protein